MKMVKLKSNELQKVIEAYKLIDNLTDELEEEKPDRTDYAELGAVWRKLYEIIEEQIGEGKDVDKFVYNY